MSVPVPSPVETGEARPFAEHGSRARPLRDRLFEAFCLSATGFSMLALIVLLGAILVQGVAVLSGDFLTNYPSRHPERAGILPALWGSFWLVALTALISISVGVSAAIYLEEYRPRGSASVLMGRLRRLIQLNLSNLAGVPSVVYGILGLAVFVRTLGQGRSLIAGALTMSLLILPVIIIAAQEALRAFPDSLRQASYALGATRWQTIRHQVLPATRPGILTGVILALSRAVGETAPLIMVGAFAVVFFCPGAGPDLPRGVESPADLLSHPAVLASVPRSEFTAMPILIYEWTKRPQEAFRERAAGAIVVLLGLLLTMNAAAIVLRQRAQKAVRW